MIRHSKARDESIVYSICGQVVCEKCFRMTYGLKRHRFASIKAKFLTGAVDIEHGRKSKSYRGCEWIRTVSWLRTFFNRVGDKMPASKDIHLPSCLTKSDVYVLAASDLSQGGLECCSRTTFYRIWITEFPDVKIPKV